MKKIVLGLFLLGAVFTAEAQSFITEKDTSKGSIYSQLNLYNNITNISSAAFKITWKVTANDFPASWAADGVLGICDNNLCRSNLNNQLFTQPFMSVDYMPNVKGDFHVQLTNFEATTVPSGSHYMTVNLKEGINEKNITFVVTKFPTGVVNIAKTTDNIVVYPNPAHDDLNVVFDKELDVKNITVYNLIGKVVSVYKVNGNSAKLEIGNTPSGIYFIRLSDTQGRIVATRKFTRQ